MGKASSEETVSDAQLKELVSIGKSIKKPTTPTTTDSDSEDKNSTLKRVKALRAKNSGLVLDKYWDAFEEATEKGLSRTEIAKQIGLSRGTIYKYFDKIENALTVFDDVIEAEDAAKSTSKIGTAKGLTVVVEDIKAVDIEIPALTAERVTELYKKAKTVQLDPRALLPPEESTTYKLSREHQGRRGPRTTDEDESVKSVLEVGIIEKPTIQAAASFTGHIQRPIDGYNRLQWWILADEIAGGTAKKPVLEYPMCDVIACTNEEAALIAHIKNKDKENYDEADRDYSIVQMHEKYPQTYTVTKLAELFQRDKSTVSNIIRAWQDSWPKENPRKTKRPSKVKWENPIRTALEERKITTYHGMKLAGLKKFPYEQMRIGRWLLAEVDKHKRSDGNITTVYISDIGRRMHVTDEGVSAGRIQQMVRDALSKQESIVLAAKELEKLKKKGMDPELDEAQVEIFRGTIGKQLPRDVLSRGELLRTSMKEAMKLAGIKQVSIQPDPNGSKKPKSPARAKEDREPEPIKVCLNCQFCFKDDESCPLELSPNENNECYAQFPGSPAYYEYKCVFCNGITISKFVKALETEISILQNDIGDEEGYSHNLCMSEHMLDDVAVSGKCTSCMNMNCGLLQTIPEGMELSVKECPIVAGGGRVWYDKWHIPKPKVKIESFNKEVQNLVDEYLKRAKEMPANDAISQVIAEAKARRSA